MVSNQEEFHCLIMDLVVMAMAMVTAMATAMVTVMDMVATQAVITPQKGSTRDLKTFSDL